MKEQMYLKLKDVQGDWTVILNTDEDGIQVFHFNSRKVAFEFADGFQDYDVIGVMERPFYTLHLEEKLNKED